MSWQTYVDQTLVGSQKVTQAAILGLNGAVWAASVGFTTSPQEAAALSLGFTNPTSIQAAGIQVNGVRYFYLRSDDRTIQGKKGNSGIVIVKTKQSMIIGAYNDQIQPGTATMAVEKLADYLIDNGF